MRTVQIVAVAMSLASVIACSSDSKPSSAPASASTSSAPACSNGNVQIAAGAQDIPAPADRHPVMFVIINQGDTACSLDGYPELAFYAQDKAAFDVANRGGGIVADIQPRRIVLNAGREAFFLIDKGDCATTNISAIADIGNIQVKLPDGGGSTVVANPNKAFRFCGLGDAGSTVHVSPFVTDKLATLAAPPVNS